MSETSTTFFTALFSGVAIGLGGVIVLASESLGDSIDRMRDVPGEVCFRAKVEGQNARVCARKSQILEAAINAANEKTAQQIKAYIKPPNP